MDGVYLYGADYNPEQWMDSPEILDKDIELMKQGGFNAVSIGIFSWSVIEPEKDIYDFSFFDNIIEKLNNAGIKILLATPSAAIPIWMSKQYPQVLRVNENRIRVLPGRRAEHCISSPVLRERIYKINKLLSERYKDKIYMWHIGNEYYGECHCELCQQKFREYLKKKYNNNLQLLNRCWWNEFWSGRYSSWDEIESPSPHGRFSSGTLLLEWKRFTTLNTIDFMKNEISAVSNNVPVTTNFHGGLEHLDYSKFIEDIDVTAWDMYPHWHMRDDFEISCETAFVYDYCRSLKNKPFLLMESAPSCPNHLDIPNKMKKPGFNILSSLHAVAHGADSVQFFQWRKSRGGFEKMHGAVVDHYGGSDTRVFMECERLGSILKQLYETSDSTIKSDVAIVYDTESRWMLDYVAGYSHNDLNYKQVCIKHYSYFYERGINADIIGIDADFTKYKLVIAPMLYMIKNEDEFIRYVNGGGTLVMTYISGITDEYDRCRLGGFPAGKLKDVFGIRAEETDCIMPNENVYFAYGDKSCKAVDFCELIRFQGANTIAKFKSGVYAGFPAVTENSYGKGKAYYIGARCEKEFLNYFYTDLCGGLDITSTIKLPKGVALSTRENQGVKYLFLQNFTEEKKEVILDNTYLDIQTEERVESLELNRYETRVLKSIL